MFIKRYSNRMQVPLSNLNILIIGVAFKGIPETADIRGSVAIDVLNKLNGCVNNVFGWDAVIDSKNLKEIGFNILDDLDSIVDCVDVVLILNNHPNNACSSIYIPPKNNRLVFDGWNQIDRSEIEKTVGMTYATMGYVTP